VADGAGRLGLAQEALHRVRLALGVRVHDLDGHPAVDPGVLGLVDRTHAALPQQADEAVLPVDYLADELDHVTLLMYRFSEAKANHTTADRQPDQKRRIGQLSPAGRGAGSVRSVISRSRRRREIH